MEDKENEENVESPGGASAETLKPETPMIPKNRLDEVIAERQQLKARLEALEAKEAADAEKALKQQGEYQRLYEAEKARAEAAQAALVATQRDALRRDIAQEAGFPQFWNRIEGSNEEELRADMQAFTAALPKPKAPNIDATTGSGARTSEKDNSVKMTKAQRRHLASMLNVPEEHLPETF